MPSSLPPWEVLGDGFAVFGGAPSHLIARCNPIEDEPSDAEWDEAEANTRLIAAAPVLLDALIALLRATSTIEVLGEWEALDINARLRTTERAKVEAVLDRASAAIEKAVAS